MLVKSYKSFNGVALNFAILSYSFTSQSPLKIPKRREVNKNRKEGKKKRRSKEAIHIKVRKIKTPSSKNVSSGFIKIKRY